jgi:threonine dehydrogenase-like Zn-dependent dehydrogenase
MVTASGPLPALPTSPPTRRSGPLTPFPAIADGSGVLAPIRRVVKPGARVAVFGAYGPAGLLATVAAAEACGPTGEVLALVHSPEQAAHIRALGLSAVTPSVVDSAGAGGLRLSDVVLDCAGQGGTEATCAAICRDGGQLHFFHPAASFQAALLGAAAVGRTLTIAIGRARAPEATDEALALVGRHPRLGAALLDPTFPPSATP